MPAFCTVTGLRVVSQPEWCSQKVSETFESNFHIVGDSIIYSRPAGYADLNGVKKSFALNDEVARAVSGGSGSYIQIEDYGNVNGSASETRKYVAEKLNSDPRRAAIIFCNTSLPLFIAIKIGRRLINTKIEVRVAKTYRDAIQLALKLNQIKTDENNRPMLKLCTAWDQKSSALFTVDVFTDKVLDIQTEEFSSYSSIIDHRVLHSACSGYFKAEHIGLTERLLNRCHNTLPGKTIRYNVVDCSRFKGIHPAARFEYMKALRKWYIQYPLEGFILYNVNRSIKAAVHIARLLMPFKMRIARDIRHAFQIIQKGTNEESSGQLSGGSNDDLTSVSQNDINRLITSIGSLNWGGDIDDSVPNNDESNEDHPFYNIYQSIKLIKEEVDGLLFDRMQTENALRENQKFLEAIIENIPDMIFLKDATNLQFVRFNKAGEKMLGYKRKELIGKNDYDFFPKEEADFFTGSDRDVLRSGELLDIPEETIQTKLKQQKILHTKKIPILDSNNKPLYLLGISEDISDKKKVEAVERFQAQVMSQIHDSVITVDMEGIITSWNNGSRRLFHYTEEEILGKHITLLYPSYYHETLVNDIIPALLNQGCHEYEVELRRKGGDAFTGLVSLSVLKDSKGEINGMIGYTLDITKQKTAEQEREQLILQLQEAIAKIKTLNGLIPICSSCKKIRDDKGYWNILESYIQEHSDAQFSHSMCPECSEELYGEEEWYVKMVERRKAGK